MASIGPPPLNLLSHHSCSLLFKHTVFLTSSWTHLLFTCLRTHAGFMCLEFSSSRHLFSYVLISFRSLFNVNFSEMPSLRTLCWIGPHTQAFLILFIFFNSAFWFLIYDTCCFVYCLSSPVEWTLHFEPQQYNLLTFTFQRALKIFEDGMN